MIKYRYRNQNYTDRLQLSGYFGLLLCLYFMTITKCWASNDSLTQDLLQLHEQATDYLKQSVKSTVDTQITVKPLDSHIQLTACAAVDFFFPPNAQQRGNIRLGARCSSPKNWSIFLSASILEAKHFFTVNNALEKGHILKLEDLTPNTKYSQYSPVGLIDNPLLIVGRTLSRALTAGSSLRNQDLLPDYSVLRGQAVKIISTGLGFQISSQGQALDNANAGQAVKVRTLKKQIINGIARSNGIVEIALQ
jgi:flagella basal body P-ring formation protein FlgA